MRSDLHQRHNEAQQRKREELCRVGDGAGRASHHDIIQQISKQVECLHLQAVTGIIICLIAGALEVGFGV